MFQFGVVSGSPDIDADASILGQLFDGVNVVLVAGEDQLCHLVDVANFPFFDEVGHFRSK